MLQRRTKSAFWCILTAGILASIHLNLFDGELASSSQTQNVFGMRHGHYVHLNIAGFEYYCVEKKKRESLTQRKRRRELLESFRLKRRTAYSLSLVCLELISWQ